VLQTTFKVAQCTSTVVASVAVATAVEIDSTNLLHDLKTFLSSLSLILFTFIFSSSCAHANSSSSSLSFSSHLFRL
jgi:hypothetical protein